MITRFIGFVLILIGAGYIFVGALDVARVTLHIAQSISSASTLCADSDNAPIIRLDTREDINAYLAACHTK